MSDQDIALCAVTALTVCSVARLTGGLLADRKWRESPGIALLILAVGLVCGVWAAIGWAWLLSGGVVS
jgi:hypothetical protein